MLHYALMTEEQLEEAAETLRKAIENEKRYSYVETNQLIEDMQKDLNKLYAVWRVK